MSQARITDHVLAQIVADWRITNPDDVEYWRRKTDVILAHGLAYLAEHPPPARWVDDPDGESSSP